MNRAIIPLALLAKKDIIFILPSLSSLNCGVITSAFNTGRSMDLKYSTDAQLIIILFLWFSNSLLIGEIGYFKGGF